MTIIAAADGSALGNPGPAGWGWYVDPSCWASGGWAHGTNNMGELTAVLDLLQQSAHLDDDLLVFCDSLYVINSVTKWMRGWKRRGWRKGDGKPVLNVEIMQALDVAVTGRKVELPVGQRAQRPPAQRGGRPARQRGGHGLARRGRARARPGVRRRQGRPPRRPARARSSTSRTCSPSSRSERADSCRRDAGLAFNHAGTWCSASTSSSDAAARSACPLAVVYKFFDDQGNYLAAIDHLLRLRRDLPAAADQLLGAGLPAAGRPARSSRRSSTRRWPGSRSSATSWAGPRGCREAPRRS